MSNYVWSYNSNAFCIFTISIRSENINYLNIYIMGTYKTYLVSDWAFCCRKVSLCILMAWRLFLSRSLAAAGIFWIKKLSGNQIILAVRVMAGTWNRKWKRREIIKCRLNNKLFNNPTTCNGRQPISRKIMIKRYSLIWDKLC